MKMYQHSFLVNNFFFFFFFGDITLLHQNIISLTFHIGGQKSACR